MKIQQAKDEAERKIKEEEEKKKAEEEKKKKEEEDKKLQKIKEEEDKKKKEEEDKIKIKKSEEDALKRKQELEEKRKLQREEERLKKEEDRKKKEEEEKKRKEEPLNEESKPSKEVQESPKEAPASVLRQSKGSVKDKLVVFAEESKKSGETHTAVSKGPVSKAGPSIKDRQAAVAASLAAAVAPKETSSPKESVIAKTRGGSISEKISQIKQEQAKDAAEPVKKEVATRKMSVPASFETDTPEQSPKEPSDSKSNEISPRLGIPKRAMGPSGRRPKSTHVKSELDAEDEETVE